MGIASYFVLMVPKYGVGFNGLSCTAVTVFDTDYDIIVPACLTASALK